MKRIIKIWALLLMLVFPMHIFAAESAAAAEAADAGMDIVGSDVSITNENRTVYFMRYPNGLEIGTEDQNVANNAEEILLYEGTTNSSGEIILEGWKREGQLRIVEDVPNGYTTNIREINVDLSQNSTTSFTNYKGFVNPNTSRSLIIILVVAILVCLVAISLMKRQNDENNKDKKDDTKKKKVKKTALWIIVPVAALALTGIIHNVRALDKDFIITVKDNRGNKMANVSVKVFAKPIVEQDKSIKFSAGDGAFLDGSREMYFRLPSETCTFDEFFQSLSDDQREYLRMNWDFSYLDGFLRTTRFVNMARNVSSISNGTVITETYNVFKDLRVVTVKGNGGYLDFYGRQLTEINIYDDMVSEVGKFFGRDGYYNIGLDSDSNCSGYNQYGLVKKVASGAKGLAVSTYYTCWMTKPDGIYVNGYLFKGTNDTCFGESSFDWSGDSFQVRSFETGRLIRSYGTLNNTFKFSNITERKDTLTTSFLYPGNVNLLGLNGLGDETDTGSAKKRASSAVLVEEEITGNEINSIVVVKNGQEILSINENDIECTGLGVFGSISESICSISAEKRSLLVNYFRNVSDNCFITLIEPGKDDLPGITDRR